MTLPEYALGIVRLFEPADLERKGNLMTVQITLPEGDLTEMLPLSIMVWWFPRNGWVHKTAGAAFCSPWI